MSFLLTQHDINIEILFQRRVQTLKADETLKTKLQDSERRVGELQKQVEQLNKGKDSYKQVCVRRESAECARINGTAQPF